MDTHCRLYWLCVTVIGQVSAALICRMVAVIGCEKSQRNYLHKVEKNVPKSNSVRVRIVFCNSWHGLVYADT